MATGSMPTTQSVTAATLSLEEILRLLDSSSSGDSVCGLSDPEDGFDEETFTGQVQIARVTAPYLDS